MFSSAYSAAVKFTRPIITLIRQENGTVKAGVGTFIVLNKDGWILTCAHILQPLIQAQIDGAQRTHFASEKARIEADASIPHKNRKLRELDPKGEWISNMSFLLSGSPTAAFTGNVAVEATADIGIARINDISSLDIREFPKFAKPGSEITPGTSLCTLGFPFNSIKATFNTKTNQFQLAEPPQFAFFPTAGIHTRNAVVMETQTGRQIMNIETSSPGLKGQSGGPIFDVNGTVWAIQSKTSAYSLDIAPSVKENGKDVREHQFIHIGLGCHVNHIRQFLETWNVQFETV